MTLTNLLQQTLCIVPFFLATSCGQSTSEQTIVSKTTTDPQIQTVERRQNPTDFLPKGYTLFETIEGDLNKDRRTDLVYIIKATDTSRIIKDERGKLLDQNRRGIIVLFKKSGYYELAVSNYDCFSSENEDPGNYMPPDLSVQIKNNILLVHYGNGRNGYWQYHFRYHNSDFELLRYVLSEGGAVINSQTSIDFVSKKKLMKVNTNANAIGGDEVFTTTSETISSNELIQLSEIKDFDSLDVFWE